MSAGGDHDDFAFEPIPGLPEELPEGEHILWQGSPCWWGLARHALHVRKVAAYCAILVAWVALSGLAEGQATWPLVSSLAGPAGLTVTLIAILLGLAFWLARSTIYTITNRRVVMRFGIVLPITVNLPFLKIESAALKRHGDGSGDIPLALKGKDRLAWLHLWPHGRPWHLRRPEPMLRDVQEAERVAALLADAMAAAVPDGKATMGDVDTRQDRATARRGRELATA